VRPVPAADANLRLAMSAPAPSRRITRRRRSKPAFRRRPAPACVNHKAQEVMSLVVVMPEKRPWCHPAHEPPTARFTRFQARVTNGVEKIPVFERTHYAEHVPSSLALMHDVGTSSWVMIPTADLVVGPTGMA